MFELASCRSHLRALFIFASFASATACSSPAPTAAAEPEKGVADFPQLSAESDWPWWRGPSRNGIAPASAKAPVTWSATQNVIWKTPVPGRGHSSPIVVGDRVFLTTADTRQQIHSVLAFDRKTGDSLWKTDVSKGGFPRQNHPKNTEATSTIACDGERLFATFFHHETVEIFALDFAGKVVWQKTVQPFNPRRYEYGYAPSPVLYRDTVIVAAEYDGPSNITALDRKSGAVVWQAARQQNITFSTPSIAHVAGRDQLLISGAGQVASYDPASGKPIWSLPGTTAATCGTMVWDGDIVIASGGYPQAQTIAIKASGRGEVLWRNAQKCYEQSLLAVDGHVYGLNDGGILFCWRTRDGQEMWKQRLAGPVSASPILVGGHIYWSNELGTTYVFKPDPKACQIVAENKLGDESFASPAVAGSQLFLRVATGSGGERREFLYCLGE